MILHYFVLQQAIGLLL
jgi:hypothetical protein